ncbi:phosphinothricin acetyltransferase [Roseovarius marisflavi]|uniref:Phosphinothricin acetyltransferase n=1 Tax=Roseovarius marisflavi TaxID=1054996 RepID=A0A1M6YM45_9RHOB|nr:GNAT family N-acetyltransferase [Roseovarius marisflavi]SHL19099.1 phosphinothricin acetyltransferase [Roseovarius marisflavi]
MIIRPAGPGDSAAILAIWNPLIRDTSVTFTTLEKTPQALADDIAARGAAFLVAQEGHAILGFATYGAFRSGPGYARTAEHTVILAPEAQGRGVGRALMKELEAVARAQGLHALVAGVSGENAGAIAFHTAISFRQVAHMPEVGRKFDRWMDLVLLQKLL